MRPPNKAPGEKRKLTFPPAIGTFESNQKRRAMLVAKQRAAQQSVQRIGLLARISKWFGAIANR